MGDVFHDLGRGFLKHTVIAVGKTRRIEIMKMTQLGNPTPEIKEKMRKTRLVKKGIKTRYKIPSPLKTLRAKCLECCVGSSAEVHKCHLSDCPIWPYRFGRPPKPEDLIVPEYDHYGEQVGSHEYKGYGGEANEEAA